MKLVEKKVVYEFDHFRVDSVNHLLFRDGEVIPLTAKIFDILLYFVEHSGRLLEKDELMQRFWPDNFVEEGNLTRNVSTLRKALNDDPKIHQYIVTIPGHGYRFDAPVKPVPEAAPQVIIQEQTVSTTVIQEELSPSDELTSLGDLPAIQKAVATNVFQRNHNPVLVVAAVACLALALFIGPVMTREKSPVPAANHSPIKSIAVLPLTPLNVGNRDPAYELGIADSLILKLSGIKQLIVRPLNSTRKYASLEPDPIAAGREQQVDYVLSSTYQLADGRIRVTAELVDVRDGSVTSVFKCDEKCDDIFATQDAISEKLGPLVLARLNDEESHLLARRYTSNEEAYRLYLQGKYSLSRRNVPDFRKAIDAFEQAIRLDPNYALAYAELAWAHWSLVLFEVDIPEETRKAKDAVMKALALDDSLAEAYSVLGTIKDEYDWDFSGGEQSLKRALELNPNSSQAHGLYGYHLLAVGRLEEAIAEMKMAIELDPTSPGQNRSLGDALYYSRHFDEAITQFKRIVAMDASFQTITDRLWRAYEVKGDYDQACQWYLRCRTQEGASARELQAIPKAYAKWGWRGILQLEIERLEQEEKKGESHYNDLAGCYAQLGNRGRALLDLEKNCESRGFRSVMFPLDPRLDPLRSDPRFEELAHRVGMK